MTVSGLLQYPRSDWLIADMNAIKYHALPSDQTKKREIISPQIWRESFVHVIHRSCACDYHVTDGGAKPGHSTPVVYFFGQRTAAVFIQGSFLVRHIYL